MDPPVFNHIPWSIFKGVGQYSLEAPSIFKLFSATSLWQVGGHQKQAKPSKAKDKPSQDKHKQRTRRRPSQEEERQAKRRRKKKQAKKKKKPRSKCTGSECKEKSFPSLNQTGEGSSIHLNLGCFLGSHVSHTRLLV